MMVAEAALLLQKEGLDSLTRLILSCVAVLDHYGAWQWNLRLVGVVSAAIFAAIRLTFGKKRGIDWYALTHAIISAYGSLACVYLDLFAAEALTGTPEPLRSCQCLGPMTSLHRILPAITLGYSIFDLIDGVTISLDFALHGLGTLSVMAFYVEHNQPNFITPMLIMEVSTLFLTVVRADFFPPMVSVINQSLFALNFLLFRVMLAPYIWSMLMATMVRQMPTEEYQSCFPAYFFPFSLILGICFHILNWYWFIKIVKKARRKLAGTEGVSDNNDLGEKEMKEKKET